jgi:hypothetical protein
VCAEILLRAHDAQTDTEHRDAIALALRRELLELDVDDVRQVEAGKAPPGTRATDVTAVGELLVVIPTSLQAIANVVNLVRGWVGRGSPGRTVEINLGGKSLKLGAASPEEQDRLVSEFLRSVQETEGQ